MTKSLLCSFSTLGGIGRLYGSGTIATLLTLPLVYVLSHVPVSWYGAVIALLIIIGLKASASGIVYYENQDPAEVVIDEVVGCLITFIALPINWFSLITGFFLFRFFDITKYFGVRRLGTIRGAWGILLDDIAAGILANSVVHLLLKYVIAI